MAPGSSPRLGGASPRPAGASPQMPACRPLTPLSYSVRSANSGLQARHRNPDPRSVQQRLLPSILFMKSARLLVLAALLISSPFGRLLAGNAVLDWNQQALDATRLARNPPPHSALYLATFHIAIFDAVNGITRTNQGWLINEPAPAGADMDAAIAGAAYTVLNNLWTWTNPRTLQIAYDKALAALPDGQAKTDGLAWGKKVAEAVLAKRADSGYNKPIPGKYSSTEPGKWRETPGRVPPAHASLLGQGHALRADHAVAVPGAPSLHDRLEGIRGRDRLREQGRRARRRGPHRVRDPHDPVLVGRPRHGDAPRPLEHHRGNRREEQEPLRPRDGAALRPPEHGRGRRSDQRMGDKVLLQHVAP
jgi:hypothetical protein